jgi:hypothetical protein
MKTYGRITFVMVVLGLLAVSANSMLAAPLEPQGQGMQGMKMAAQPTNSGAAAAPQTPAPATPPTGLIVGRGDRHSPRNTTIGSTRAARRAGM